MERSTGGLTAMVKIWGISYQSGGDGIGIGAKTKKSENWCVHDSSQRLCPPSRRKELLFFQWLWARGVNKIKTTRSLRDHTEHGRRE